MELLTSLRRAMSSIPPKNTAFMRAAWLPTCTRTSIKHIFPVDTKQFQSAWHAFRNEELAEKRTPWLHSCISLLSDAICNLQYSTDQASIPWWLDHNPGWTDNKIGNWNSLISVWVGDNTSVCREPCPGTRTTMDCKLAIQRLVVSQQSPQPTGTFSQHLEALTVGPLSMGFQRWERLPFLP